MNLIFFNFKVEIWTEQSDQSSQASSAQICVSPIAWADLKILDGDLVSQSETSFSCTIPNIL